MVICEGSNWQASLKNYFPTLSVASIPLRPSSSGRQALPCIGGAEDIYLSRPKRLKWIQKTGSSDLGNLFSVTLYI